MYLLCECLGGSMCMLKHTYGGQRKDNLDSFTTLVLQIKVRSPCLQTGTSPTKPSHGPLFQFSNLFSWCCTHKAQIILALFNGPFNCVKDICIVAQRILRTFSSCETEAPYILNITPPTPIRLSIFRSSATHIHHLYGNEVFYFILYQIFYICLISFSVRTSVFLIVAYCGVSFS